MLDFQFNASDIIRLSEGEYGVYCGNCRHVTFFKMAGTAPRFCSHCTIRLFSKLEEK